jgi:hypothetical protein
MAPSVVLIFTEFVSYFDADETWDNPIKKTYKTVAIPLSNTTFIVKEYKLT